MIFKIFKYDIQMRPLYWISVNVPYNFMYCRKAKPSKQIFSFPHLYMSLFIFPFPLFPYDTIECFLIKQKVEQSIDFSKEEYKMYAITLGWFSNINISYPINVYSYKAGLSCKANTKSTI